MENEEQLIKTITSLTNANVALTDALALICSTIEKNDPESALYIKEALKAVSNNSISSTTPEFVNVANRLVAAIDDPEEIRFVSAQKHPERLNPEELRNSLSVVPHHEE